jgi:hypothetical protein|tara:strand:- start:588 stop:1133 length:546 start_codon:yes stop_codon:yes gene_type:complete
MLYINFDQKTGTIKSFTNVEPDSSFIEVDSDTYKDFIDGKKLMQDYIVIPSTKDKVFELVGKNKDLMEFDVDQSIHKLVDKKPNSKNYVEIVQDIKQKVWEVTISNTLKTFLSSSNFYKDKMQYVYITEKNNPNILIDTLSIPISELLQTGTYKIKNNIASNKNTSLYCIKVFDAYYHRRK